ncbi:MAG: DUF58 domain-containing protein [Phycisphaerae bacterium]
MAKLQYRFFKPTHAAQLRRMEFTVRGVVEGVYAGLHKSPHKGFSIEFAEHREYVPGDEIKHLDWTVLAKTDRYYVKQYEQETNLRATICLDASASMRFGSAVQRDPATGTGNPVNKYEYASVLACSLAYLLSNQQDVVGLIGFDDKIRIEIPQGNGPSHLDQFFVGVEKLAPSRTTHLAETLHQVADRIPRRGLVILISDLFDDPNRLTNAFEHLRHYRHQLVVLHVMDPQELELNYNRPITFEDMEDGSRLQIDPKAIRDDYRREVQEFIELLKKKCGRAKIDYLLSRTDVPWDAQIRSLLMRTSRR